jgi:hypothetical protein
MRIEELDVIPNPRSLMLLIWPKLRDITISTAQIQGQPINTLQLILSRLKHAPPHFLQNSHRFFSLRENSSQDTATIGTQMQVGWAIQCLA